MEKKNPNSHNLPIQVSSNSWSELPSDLFNSVFERLNFADFRRAESACSSWYSASKRCVTKNQSLWLILFPEDDEDNNNNNNNNHSCTLFNPEEKGGKIYKTQDQGIEFATHVCLAIHGIWLLMDPNDDNNLYILNLFNKERINLPLLDLSVDGWSRISNDDPIVEWNGIVIKSPVFWIDEQTKDYVVVLGFGKCGVVYSKKGDNSWNQIPLVSDVSDMVYKDHKLYFLGNSNSIIKIFEFSGEIPQEIFQCECSVINPNISVDNDNRYSWFIRKSSWFIRATKLVVTVTGDVLKVDKMIIPLTRVRSFRVYKVYSSGGVFKNYEQVESLGHDEAMLFDLGITVLASVMGFKGNSIYYNFIGRASMTTEIEVFNLETQERDTPLYKFACSSLLQHKRARWFLPN